MAAKLRSVNTRFWEDSFIEELSPSEKLIFIYLLTNPLTNILGIYEISIKRISYDTGINKESIKKALIDFESLSKVIFHDGFIILCNFQKNQRMNPKMLKGAIDIFNTLPNPIKTIVSDSLSIAYQSILKGSISFDKEERGKSKEEEGNKKEEKVKKEDIDFIYSIYPGKCLISGRSSGKTSKNKDKIELLLKKHKANELSKIINTYIDDCTASKTYMKNFGTLLNNLPESEESNIKPKISLSNDAMYGLGLSLQRKVKNGELTEQEAFKIQLDDN